MELRSGDIPGAPPPDDERLARLRRLITVVYALQALSFLVAVTALVGVVIDYVKRDDARGTWLESHFDWQIRTFWFGLLWGALGALTAVVFVGYLILIANAIWIIYRIVKGWIHLSEGRGVAPV